MKLVRGKGRRQHPLVDCRGREEGKKGEENMQNLLHAYSESSPAMVMAKVSKWEMELKQKALRE